VHSLSASRAIHEIDQAGLLPGFVLLFGLRVFILVEEEKETTERIKEVNRKQESRKAKKERTERERGKEPPGPSRANPGAGIPVSHKPAFPVGQVPGRRRRNSGSTRGAAKATAWNLLESTYSPFPALAQAQV
jgi:hypothetical protein